MLLGAFVAAIIGRNVGRLAGLRNVEELFICSMFSRLGEILSIYYLPEDYDEIVRTVRTRGVTERVASHEVLGISFDELGIEVAKQWNFPPSVLHAMRALPEGPLPQAPSELERIAHCAGFARELCDAAWRTRPEGREQALTDLVERFSATIPNGENPLGSLLQHSLDLGRKYCTIIGVNTQGSALIEGLQAWAQIKNQVPAPPVAPQETPKPSARETVSAAPPGPEKKAGGLGGWFRKLLA